MMNIGSVTHRPTHSQTTVVELTETLRSHRRPELLALGAMIKHPRSLARESATWHPPSRRVPRINGDGELTVTAVRRRVGLRGKVALKRYSSTVAGHSEEHEAAFLITLRFTHNNGTAVTSSTAEAWVRGLLPSAAADTVHELTGESAPTFCWFVDAAYHPVHSPASLFTEEDQAA